MTAEEAPKTCRRCHRRIVWIDDGRSRHWQSEESGSWCVNESSHEPAERIEDSNAFQAARLLRALAQARENLLIQCDEWDALAKGEFPLTIRIRELACLCEPGAPAHEHSKGGYR